MESEKILGVNGPTSGEKVICRGRDGAAQWRQSRSPWNPWSRLLHGL